MQKSAIQTAIRDIASMLLSLGGIDIAFDGNFRFNKLSLYRVKATGLVFVDWPTRFSGGPSFEFPLHDFSDTFLHHVLVEYRHRCREQLKDEVARDVERIVATALRPRGKWDVIFDQEFCGADGESGYFKGVISDGERVLFFRTDGPIGEGARCHVHNSIEMDDDSEECSYLWTAENDGILLDCLNGLENPDDFCGEGSPIRTLVFLPAEGGLEDFEYEDGEYRTLTSGSDGDMVKARAFLKDLADALSPSHVLLGTEYGDGVARISFIGADENAKRGGTALDELGVRITTCSWNADCKFWHGDAGRTEQLKGPVPGEAPSVPYVFLRMLDKHGASADTLTFIEYHVK